MKILGVDLETTGLDPAIHSVTEVGAILWDTDLNTPYRIDGYFVYHPEAVWTQESIDISGITPEMCKTYGYPYERSLRQLLIRYNEADMVCAHNGNAFDKVFIANWAKRLDYTLDEKHWIDTKSDLDIPPKFSRKLTYMAADYGFLNPFPHRAVFDVMTMLQILSKFDINEVIAFSKMPEVTLVAMVDYDSRELAKARGYHWHNEDKTWRLNLKKSFVEKEKAEAPFRVKELPSAQEK